MKTAKLHFKMNRNRLADSKVTFENGELLLIYSAHKIGDNLKLRLPSESYHLDVVNVPEAFSQKEVTLGTFAYGKGHGVLTFRLNTSIIYECALLDPDGNNVQFADFKLDYDGNDVVLELIITPESFDYEEVYERGSDPVIDAIISETLENFRKPNTVVDKIHETC